MRDDARSRCGSRQPATLDTSLEIGCILRIPGIQPQLECPPRRWPHAALAFLEPSSSKAPSSRNSQAGSVQCSRGNGTSRLARFPAGPTGDRETTAMKITRKASRGR